MDAPRQLAQLLDRKLGLLPRLSHQLGRARGIASSRDSARRRVRAMATSRCWAPSWRSRSMRRRSSSAAARMRCRALRRSSTRVRSARARRESGDSPGKRSWGIESQATPPRRSGSCRGGRSAATTRGSSRGRGAEVRLLPSAVRRLWPEQRSRGASSRSAAYLRRSLASTSVVTVLRAAWVGCRTVIALSARVNDALPVVSSPPRELGPRC